MASTAISIYAELLSNIRQISLAVSLPSPSDKSTRVSVTHEVDTSSVHVTHAGETSHLTLPGRVSCPPNQDLPLQRRSEDATLLTWRLALARDGQPREEPAVSTVPWEARDLVPGGEVACRKCQASLVKQGVVKEWKDLPAEGWAEMMEFWHCHKPGEEHHHGHGHGHADGLVGAGGTADGEKADQQTLASRGYGAASTISAQKGVGFVNLTTLLFEEGDCAGVTFSSSSPTAGTTSLAPLLAAVSTASPPAYLNIFCTACHTRIGYFNHATSAATLFKWQVLCQTNTLAPRPPPTVPDCLSATLAATLSRTASSKSLLLPVPFLPSPSPGFSVAPPILHFWILNPSVKYASSQLAGPVRAMKLLYRTVGRAEADSMLEDVNSDVQEVNLPEEDVDVVVEALRESNALLPGSERRYREWEVGMLRLWEG